MSEAMPPWRSFSSDPGEEPPPSPQHDEGDRRERPPWLLPAIIGGGGLLVGGLAAGLLGLTLVLAGSSEPAAADGAPLEPISDVGEVTFKEPATEILVDVAGAVARPGLHRLRTGDRVGDAIEAAGGFGPRVDLAAASESLNLARPLEDGAKVLVPELGTDRGERVAAAADGRIDLNRAGQAELESLPGIGPVTAGKIIAARGQRPFESIGELRDRGLVGEAVFRDIKDRISAG